VKHESFRAFFKTEPFTTQGDILSKFLFSDNKKSVVKHAPCQTWHILVVDDEEDIHEVTRLVLGKSKIAGRSITVHSALSAAQARELLQSGTEYALAFIDVVMETEHAGLELVEWIRNDLKNQNIRLILRTGQAGSAPEESVIRNYEINDYKSKTELTSTKMLTCVYTGIRGYRDLRTISRSLDSFKRLIQASTNILKINDIHLFATSVLENMMNLMNLDNSSLYIVRHETGFDNSVHGTILASTGRFGKVEEATQNIPSEVQARLDKVFQERKSAWTETCFIGFFRTSAESSSVLYIEFEAEPGQFQENLAEIYGTNVALILESLSRQIQIESNQREMLYVVADAVEAKNHKTSCHVKRITAGCALLATKLGLADSLVTAIKTAAPLYDIGKVTLSQELLHKPGALTEEEWLMMKTHAEAGAGILQRSRLPIAQLAANMARWHHENWDGSGYPEGLQGHTIPQEARIMAIIDVMDAMASHRSYRSSWSDADILLFLKSQKGKKFDPELVELIEQHFDEFVAILRLQPD
jgi:response regulator RpfG family c-di-GMP phosphodiesterase